MRTLLALAFLLAFASVFLWGCGASCKSMDVNGISRQCNGGTTGYMWTGTSCIFTRACNCTGKDCNRLYSSQEGCETAHAHCAY